jgi:hypothetical protein
MFRREPSSVIVSQMGIRCDSESSKKRNATNCGPIDQEATP